MVRHAPTEWWRPDTLSEKDSETEIQVRPVLETQDSPVAFWALMGFLFILLISPQTLFPALAPFRVAMLAAGLAMATHVIGRFKRHKPIVEFTREIALVTGLVTWAILTIPLSYWPGGSISYLLDIYFKTLIVFWLLSNVVNTLPRLRCMAWGLCLMSVPLALTTVKNFVLGAGVNRVDGYNAALTENPNDLALMLNLIIPVCIALFLANQRVMMRMILAIIIGLNVLAVFTTFSRGGFLTLAIILMTYVWVLLKRPERGWAYLALFLALVAVPFVPANYTERLGTITNIEADETGSAQTRWSDMITASKYVIQHPVIGAGIGMNILALNEERGATWTAIHNVYLQYAVELGLPGLVMFLLLLKTSYRNISIVQNYYSGGRNLTEFFYLAEGIRISLIAFVVAALFYPAGYNFYFYLIAGFAAAAKAIYDAGEKAGMDYAVGNESES